MKKRLQGNIDRNDFLGMNLDNKVRGAILVARKFLEQYNSPVVFKSAVISDTSCKITMDIGLAEEKIVEVNVDIISGTIFEFKR